MKKRFLMSTGCLTLLVSVLIFACSDDYPFEGKSNEVFEVISVEKDAVKFKTLTVTKLYSVALVSGSKVYEGKRISNEVGDIKWPNGPTFKAGSSTSMPNVYDIDAMILPVGAVINVSEFEAPGSFSAKHIRFVTEKGSPAMEL